MSHERTASRRACLDRLRRRGRDERGISMILTLGMSVVLVAAATLAGDITNISLTTSATHQTYEQALHAAEEGIDQVIARVQTNQAWNTGHLLPDGLTAAEEDAWARTQLEAAAVTLTGNGAYAVVKPSNRSVVYAGGWVPDRATAKRPRMLKAEYLFSTYSPPMAILSGGTLNISGNAGVDGIAGDVHANGDIQLSGSPTVSGDLTASGSLNVTGGGSTAGVSGTSGGGAAPQWMPPVSPREMWDLMRFDYPDAWYDLCPDGTVRSPDGSAPCAGTVLGDASSGSFRGWSTTGSGSSFSWAKDGDGTQSGIFYVHHGGAQLGRNPGSPAQPWRATVIAAGNTDGPCPQDFGDIQVGGTPVMVPFIDGIGMVAGRDIKIQGNSNQSFEGLLAAHEQIEISGNPTIKGAVLAEDACDTPGSPVSQSSISGSMTVIYDGNLNVQLGSLIRTSLWLEI